MKIANAVLLLLLAPLSSSTAEVSLKILRVGVVVCALLSAFAEDLTLTTWPHGVDLREDPGTIGTPPHQRPGSCRPPPLERVGVRLSSPLHPSPGDLGQRLSLSAEDDDRLRALSTQSLYLLPTNTNTSFSLSLSLSFSLFQPCSNPTSVPLQAHAAAAVVETASAQMERAAPSLAGFFHKNLYHIFL